MTQPQQQQRADFDSMPVPYWYAPPPMGLDDLRAAVMESLRCPECGRPMAKCAACESGKVEQK